MGAFGNAFGPIHRSGQLMHPWMLIPYFALPSTGVSLISGTEVTIYGDELINVPLISRLSVTYTCDIGNQSGNNFTILPVDVNIGDHTLTMVFKNGGIIIDTQSITLSVYAKAPSGTKKILLIGDSTMGGNTIGEKVTSILTNSTFTFLGTVGTTYKNEGWPGSTWYGFNIGTHGHFYKSGALNVPAYFTDYSIDIPDYVYIRLGINDTFSGSAIPGDGLTSVEITTILNNAKTLINAFLAFNANLKIIIAIPTICENTGAGWNNNYGIHPGVQNLFIENMHKFWQTLIATFNGGAYNTRVTCSFETIYLDRNDGYPKIGGVHSNGVHPTTLGYYQIATGVAIYLNKILKTDLAPSNFAGTWVGENISLSWVNESGTGSIFEIYESNDDITYSLLHTTNANEITYNYTLVQTGNVYYKIRAQNGFWISEYSSPIELLNPLSPSGLLATWTNDYAALTWVDNTGGVAVYEVWESKNEGEYTLTTTTTSGATSYNDYTWQNASINFKIRAKIDSWYSDYSEVINLSTPLVFKTNQSTLTNLLIANLTVSAGKTVNINWGDSTNNNYSGSTANITKTYSSTQNPYYVKISGDLNSITNITINYQTILYGDLSKWIIPINLIGFQLQGLFTGNISGWVMPSTLTYLSLNSSGFSGDISNWNIINIGTFQFAAGANHVSGDLSNWHLKLGATQFYAPNQDFTGIPRGHYKNLSAGIGMYFNQNNCTSTEIDNFLVDVNNYFTTNTPIQSSLFLLNGTGMGIPSATGLAAKTGIEQKYIAAGFTATITVNT